MNFEHLIVINDPGNPLIVPLNRRQVWEGLLQRVYHPLPFLPGLESCTLLQREDAFLRRELDFGAARISDRVTMAVEEWVHFEIEPGEQHPGGSLTIRIEEPAPEQLCLRFIYATAIAAEDQAYIDYIKSAYQQSDIDCVQIIRTLAADGPRQ